MALLIGAARMNELTVSGNSLCPLVHLNVKCPKHPFFLFWIMEGGISIRRILVESMSGVQGGVLRGITHDQSDHVRLKMKEVDHQNEHRELGGLPRGLLESLRLAIHRPVFVIAINGELDVKTEKAVR